MTTLREEIINEIQSIVKSYNAFSRSTIIEKDSKICSEKILSKIEKRIDIHLNKYLKNDWNDLYIKGLIEGLSNFKDKELLKN